MYHELRKRGTGRRVTRPRFFKTQADWRAWLEKNHDKTSELVVGFHKAATGKPSITHKQALDEALCFGWIDGVAHGGDTSWTIRFTPRRKGSVWSDINIARVGELTKLGRMHPAGLAAFEKRDPKKQKHYSNENRGTPLDPAYEKKFRANRKAWAHFESRPPSYRRPAIWWVMSAKKPETRARRLATLIADSEAGRRIALLTPSAKRQKK
jgi:uncharacterized protein YdeI (YjbR/CyaY-like superfamily)